MLRFFEEHKSSRLFASAMIFGTLTVSGHCVNDWVWTGGTNQTNLKFTGLIPPSVEKMAVAKDAAGNTFLFGGIAYGDYMDPLQGAKVGFGSLNDIYRYSESTGFTKLTGGSPDLNPTTNYGTKGTGVLSNRVGGRQGATLWTDASGNPWTFGGFGSNTSGLNQMVFSASLWKFDVSTGFWIWMKGPDASNSWGEYGTKGSPAAGNNPSSRFDPVYWKDSSGNFWIFGGYGMDSFGFEGYLNDVWKFDISTQNWIWVRGDSVVDMGSVVDGGNAQNNTPAGRTLSASWKDAAGNLWVFGGQQYNATANLYMNYSDLWKFDGNVWTRVKNPGTTNQSPNYGTKGVASANSTPGGRYNATTWVDPEGKFWLYGGQSSDSMNEEILHSDLWCFNGINWAWMSGDQGASTPPNYGSQGVLAISNTPGGRAGGAAWNAANGQLMMFGGKYFSGYDVYRHNDLWKLDYRSSAVDDWKIY